MATLAIEVLTLGVIGAVILFGNHWLLLAVPLGLMATMALLARMFPLIPVHTQIRDVRRRVVRWTIVLGVILVLACAVALHLGVAR